jgi:NADP-dependent 3-hydroxy acid dehydrogenase YdfG
MDTQWSEKVIIVTGASAGVGEATAYELAKYGARLVLAARRENRLKKIAKNISEQASDVLVVKTDLTQQKQIERLVRKTMKRFGRIDVLLNIAGWGVYSWIEKQSYKQLENQLSVNVLGGAYLTSLVVPVMQAGHAAPTLRPHHQHGLVCQPDRRAAANALRHDEICSRGFL